MRPLDGGVEADDARVSELGLRCITTDRNFDAVISRYCEVGEVNSPASYQDGNALLPILLAASSARGVCEGRLQLRREAK